MATLLGGPKLTDAAIPGKDAWLMDGNGESGQFENLDAPLSQAPLTFVRSSGYSGVPSGYARAGSERAEAVIRL